MSALEQHVFALVHLSNIPQEFSIVGICEKQATANPSTVVSGVGELRSARVSTFAARLRYMYQSNWKPIDGWISFISA